MRTRIDALVLSTVALALGPSARGATIEVSPTGIHPTIQSGIDAAAAGDVVLVKAGTYFENPRIPAGKNGLRVSGSGKVIVDANPLGAGAGGDGIVVASNSVTLDGFAIRNASFKDAQSQGNGVEVTGADFIARKLTIAGCTSSGIHVVGTDHAIIDHCTIEACDAAIFLEDGDVATIVHCTFAELVNDGVDIQQYSHVDIGDSTFTAIAGGEGVRTFVAQQSNVSVHDCSFSTIGIGAISIQATTVEIENNTITNSGFALELSGSGILARGNHIFDVIENAAISAGGATNGTIEENVIERCSEDGIFLTSNCSGFIIRNNTLKDQLAIKNAGIRVDGSLTTIEGNKLDRIAGDGVAVLGSSVTVKDNVIKNCIRDGIDVRNGASLTSITGNKISKCRAEGLDHSGSASTVTSNQITGCRIDVANNGSFQTFTLNTFVTGGTSTAPEID